MVSTLEQLRKGVGINTIIAPIKNVFDNIISSTKNTYTNIKDSVTTFKRSVISDVNTGINKSIKDLLSGNFENTFKDIKNMFNDIKDKGINLIHNIEKSFKMTITNFNNIIPNIKESFSEMAKGFKAKADDISSSISGIGNIASSIGLTGIGGFLGKIAGPAGIIMEGGQIMHGVSSWLNKNIADPINHWIHGIFSWWGDSSQRQHYQNGGLVPGGLSLFDNINAKLSSGEYVIPNYITQGFPSLIKTIENLRINKPQQQLQSTVLNGLSINENPLSKLVTISNDNFNKLNDILTKLVSNKSEQQSSNIIQSTNVNSTNINSSNNYDLILGDISV